MKRLCILFIALFCLNFVPTTLSANSNDSALVSTSELPWTTALAVLKSVDPQTDYTFEQLQDMYRSGKLRIEALASGGYAVTFAALDGSGDTVLIANL